MTLPRERIIDFLPETYHAFLPEFFERPLAEERHATCDACVMCAPANPVFPADTYFSSSTKCCTFHPVLPNYSIGGLLQDRSDAGAEGLRRIRRALTRRDGVTPVGILPPAKTSLLLRAGKRGFGRASSLLCPYFDEEGGGCSVWAHREGTCSTWFCKHNNGLDGRDFWNQLRDYLVGVQRVLVAYVLIELGFDAQTIAAGFGPRADLGPRDLDDAPPSDDEYARLWGTWLNREEELYASSYDLVRALDRKSYAALAGVHGKLELGLVAKRHEAIDNPRLPDPLRKNPAMRQDRAPDGSYILTSYENGESTRLRKPVFDLLDYFDGARPTDDVTEVYVRSQRFRRPDAGRDSGRSRPVGSRDYPA